MKNRISLVLAVAVLLLTGCSTQKNTFMSRSYHSVTSKYNILFNGNESFKKGHQTMVETYRDNFSEVLPVFYYSNKTHNQSIASDMDRTIRKAEKVISLHSITVKPELKGNKQLSPRRRDFYNKNEFNMFVDETYLIMGKAYFYNHQFDKAQEVFTFIISNFRKGKPVLGARIWLARTYIETGDFKLASELLKELEAEKRLGKRYRHDLDATQAHLRIIQQDYVGAAPYLETTRKTANRKRFRVRYTFTLAQVYDKAANPRKASEMYNRVIKMNPPYEMAFQARINRALAYEKGHGSVKEIETQLLRMLRDDKNIDYQDQIYYALGNLALKEGDKPLAIERYRMSLGKTFTNVDQKARTCLTLADLYYEQPDYVNAQAYYDSAVTNLGMDYPGYDLIFAKARNLSILVRDLNTIALEDSVQQLSKLPRPELLAFIDGLIEEIRLDEEAERQLEMQQALDEEVGFHMPLGTKLGGMEAAGGDQWYFYNETAKMLGQKDFKAKWGNRRLEDNWRRKNRVSTGFGASAVLDDSMAPEEEEDALNSKEGNKSREYYLKNIPLTDSALTVSHRRLENALLRSGMTYKNDLKDNEKAIESFNELARRYPFSDNSLQAYYQLYSIYTLENNASMSGFYKDQIINQFPESTYANMLSNPNYLKELEYAENRVKDYYNQTYLHFRNAAYGQVISQSDYAFENFSGDKLLPQFALLRAFAMGHGGDVKAYRQGMSEVVSSYPDTDAAERAKQVIAFIDRNQPSIAEEETSTALKLYQFVPNTQHWFTFVFPKGRSFNQLVFNIINFNLDNYDRQNLRVETAELNDQQVMVVIKAFQNAKSASDYYSKITVSSDIFRDVDPQGVFGLILSEPNFQVLQSDRSTERYMKFFIENYKVL